MAHWEESGKSSEWYTPACVFDALGCSFNLDVAHPVDDTHTSVPAYRRYSSGGLEKPWHGFVWMNPPFGGRNSLKPWLDKFFAHGDGVALVPDRTSAPWWQEAARKADAFLFVNGKIRFIRPDGTEGASPSTGTTLFACGYRGIEALSNAHDVGFGLYSVPLKMPPRKQASRPVLTSLQPEEAA